MLKSTSDKILDEMPRHISDVALLIKVVMNCKKDSVSKIKQREEIIKLEAHLQRFTINICIG